MTKKLIGHLLTSVATAALLLAATGCAGLKVDGAGQGIAKGAIYYGTVKHLRAHPEDRPAFEATRVQLENIIVQTNWSAEALAAAFNALPIDSLSGPDGDLYKSTFLVVWSEAAGDSVNVQTPEEVRAIVNPLLVGLRLGLAATLPGGGTAPAARDAERHIPIYRWSWGLRYAYRTY